jgi:hypothetical protein
MKKMSGAAGTIQYFTLIQEEITPLLVSVKYNTYYWIYQYLNFLFSIVFDEKRQPGARSSRLRRVREGSDHFGSYVHILLRICTVEVLV